MDFFDFVKTMAEAAGWQTVERLGEQSAYLPFQTDEGEVGVFLRPCGKLQGETVIEFSSPGLPVPEDDGLQLAMMRLFMKRNGDMLQGHWGIEETSNGPRFTVFAQQLAGTMDPPEFEAAIKALVAEFRNTMRFLRKAMQETSLEF